jgi:hypothetical protein
MALGADVESLSFRITPLLKIGKLSAQIRDSLSELIRDARGSNVIKLRAFVAGAGDSRRVQAIVSDLFTEKKLNLPVISIIQVGALGDDAAQVVIEAVIAEKRVLNPDGLAFLAGQTGPTLDASLGKLTQSLSAASLTPSAVLSLTCFSDNLGDYRQHLIQANSLFSKASISLVQSQREPGGYRTTCEAVARSHEGDSPPQQISLLRPARVTVIPGRSRLVFTGLQLAFGGYLDDASSALKNLRKFSEAASGAARPHHPSARPPPSSMYRAAPSPSSKLKGCLRSMRPSAWRPLWWVQGPRLCLPSAEAPGGPGDLRSRFDRP